MRAESRHRAARAKPSAVTVACVFRPSRSPSVVPRHGRRAPRGDAALVRPGPGDEVVREPACSPSCGGSGFTRNRHLQSPRASRWLREECRAPRAATPSRAPPHLVRAEDGVFRHRRCFADYASARRLSTPCTHARAMSSLTSRKRQHRVRATTVPRGGVVNARRPGHRPGRSGAQTMDDGEHGTRLTDAMLVGPLLCAQRGVHAAHVDANLGPLAVFRRASCLRTIEAQYRARGRRGSSGQSRSHVGDTDTHQRWRERPRRGQGQGHPRGTAPGSFTPSLVSPAFGPGLLGGRHRAPPALQHACRNLLHERRLLLLACHDVTRGEGGSTGGVSVGGGTSARVSRLSPRAATVSRPMSPVSWRYCRGSSWKSMPPSPRS